MVNAFYHYDKTQIHKNLFEDFVNLDVSGTIEDFFKVSVPSLLIAKVYYQVSLKIASIFFGLKDSTYYKELKNNIDQVEQIISNNAYQLLLRQESIRVHQFVTTQLHQLAKNRSPWACLRLAQYKFHLSLLNPSFQKLRSEEIIILCEDIKKSGHQGAVTEMWAWIHSLIEQHTSEVSSSSLKNDK